MRYLKLEKAAPILNTPKFSEVFCKTSLPLDQDGHPQAYEFVGLPDMAFPIVREHSEWIVETSFSDYSNQPLYLDRRFGKIFTGPFDQPPRTAPSPSRILQSMEEKIGVSYVWGGNWSFGIPEMLEYYPPSGKLDERTRTLWTFQGVDCSGLFYEAANGTCPRNTRKLIHFGKPLALSHLSVDQIIPLLQPLDLIIYPGHVLFVRNSETIIESKSPMGVRVCLIKTRLLQLLEERKLVDAVPEPGSSPFFMIRRNPSVQSASQIEQT